MIKIIFLTKPPNHATYPTEKPGSSDAAGDPSLEGKCVGHAQHVRYVIISSWASTHWRVIDYVITMWA